MRSHATAFFGFCGVVVGPDGRGDKGPSALDRRKQRFDSKDRDHPFQVVRQDVETHFRPHMGKRPGQKMRVAHPGLQRAERVLHRLPAQTHAIGLTIQSILDGIQYVLMSPTIEPAVSA